MSAQDATEPALQQPQVFAPETISQGNVYRGSFTPDDQTFFFFKNVTEGEEDYRIFRSERANQRWTEPEQVDLGGDYSDLYPTISPDGQRMVFSSYRLVPGDTSSTRNANLWYADREGDDWGTPTFIAKASTLPNYDAKPFFGPDGAVYFESTTPDWSRTRSLITRWDGEVYQEPEAFDDVEHWRAWRSDLHVWGGVPGPDGSFIVFDVSERDADTGRALSSDQWISFRTQDDRWTEPVRLGAGLNSEGYDNFTFFSADGDELFFVRDFDRFYHIPLAAVLERAR
ncbi:MAG: hypothetical protein ACR2GR_08185 [Rhodothermales bacterium]